MTYLVPADFRTESLDETCRQLDLTDDEAPELQLAEAIARLTQRLNEETNDSFETEALTLELDGDGTSLLLLPKRCTAVAEVKLRDENGTLTAAQDPLSYRLRSSLYSSGSKRMDNQALDWLKVVSGGPGFTGGPRSFSSFVWPSGPQTVQVTGNFGWTTTPGDVKRALALMVYHHFKPIRADLRLATRTTTAEQVTDFALSEPTGIPEADAIIAKYRRDQDPTVRVS